MQVSSPIELLLAPLLKGHIDDADLSAKIARLYQVARRADPSVQHGIAHLGTSSWLMCSFSGTCSPEIQFSKGSTYMRAIPRPAVLNWVPMLLV